MKLWHLYNQWISPQKWLERLGVKPAMQITIGMVMLASCVLLVAQAIGFIPNQDEEVLRSRVALADTAAARLAGVVGNEDAQAAAANLETIVQSRPDLLSAALRRRDGYMLAHTGRHNHFWTMAPVKENDAMHIHVPLYRQRKFWGEMEMAFAPLPHARDWESWLRSRQVRLTAFLLTSLFLLYWMFLSRMLRVLDPSQAVPDRMQLLMDTLVEGMAILDTQERIVMTNRAFAQSTFEPIGRLMGKPLSSLNWVDEKGERLTDVHPWKAVQQSDLPQRGVSMRLQIGNRHWRRLHVNAAPILDPDQVRKGVLVTFSDETIAESNAERISRLVIDMSSASAGVSELHSRMGADGDDKLLTQLEQLTQSAKELSGELRSTNHSEADRQIIDLV
jgi:PAS domain-containing protein